MRMNIIQSIKDLNRTRRWSKSELALHLSWNIHLILCSNEGAPGSRASFRLRLSTGRVSNLGSVGRMPPRMAMNVAQLKTVNLLKPLWDYFWIMCHNVFNAWPKTALLLPVWPRDVRSLDTPTGFPACRQQIGGLLNTNPPLACGPLPIINMCMGVYVSLCTYNDLI